MSNRGTAEKKVAFIVNPLLEKAAIQTFVQAESLSVSKL